MQFTKLFVAAAAFAVASAQTYEFTNNNFTGITVGQPFTITWQPVTDPVTIKLKTGPATAQTLVSTIVSGATGGSFSWIPPATTIPNQLYNLEIDHGTDAPNYSVQFYIAGGSGSTSSSVSSAALSTTVSSSVTSSASVSSSSGTASSASTSGSSTSSKATTTASKTATSTTSSSSTTPTTNAAVQYASPFAFALMSFFAIAALN